MDDSKYIIKLLKEQGKKISNIEKILIPLNKKQGLTKSELKSKKIKYTGLTGAIFDLTTTSFFNAPKSIKDIEDQLKANAIFYPITNYPDALLRLVKHKQLRRLKDNNKWKYVKNE